LCQSRCHQSPRDRLTSHNSRQRPGTRSASQGGGTGSNPVGAARNRRSKRC